MFIINFLIWKKRMLCTKGRIHSGHVTVPTPVLNFTHCHQVSPHTHTHPVRERQAELLQDLWEAQPQRQIQNACSLKSGCAHTIRYCVGKNEKAVTVSGQMLYGRAVMPERENSLSQTHLTLVIELHLESVQEVLFSCFLIFSFYESNA